MRHAKCACATLRLMKRFFLLALAAAAFCTEPGDISGRTHARPREVSGQRSTGRPRRGNSRRKTGHRIHRGAIRAGRREAGRRERHLFPACPDGGRNHRAERHALGCRQQSNRLVSMAGRFRRRQRAAADQRPIRRRSDLRRPRHRRARIPVGRFQGRGRERQSAGPLHQRAAFRRIRNSSAAARSPTTAAGPTSTKKPRGTARKRSSSSTPRPPPATDTMWCAAPGAAKIRS